MELVVYQKLEQIINVTAMANKWLRWCEQSLPNQAVFVPSVFQMRDAYSHMISMFAQGIEEQGLVEGVSEERKFDEVSFFKSDIASVQLSEVCEHVLRAYFDTADYIVESLAEICNGSNKESESVSYPLLRCILKKYDTKISDLRAQKSMPPGISYQTVLNWDSLLQIITSAYAFADYERTIHDLYRKVFNVVLDIEERFEETVIKEFSPDFFKEKIELAKLKELPVEYEKFVEDEGDYLKCILEDPVQWQKNITNEFYATRDRLKELFKKHRLLLETMPSTALIRKAKGGQGMLKKAAVWFVATVVSGLLTALVGKKMFLNNQMEAVVLNLNFLVKICILFVCVELLLMILWWGVGKIGMFLIKGKCRKS